MLITRLTKVMMCFALGLFCLLVAFDNVFDPGTNYTFVQHVLSMDTTFPENGLKYRAITNPIAWQAAYAAIIVAEGFAGLLFVAGAIRLLRVRNAPAADFNREKDYAVAGGALAFLIWFFGFTVVGGEWFAMWESKIWNGQETAFRFYITAVAVLIFLNQPDGEISE
jgi:predicted small integral membrane protein